MENKVLNLINKIDEEGNYFGIIPMFPLVKNAMMELQLSIENIHEILIDMEKNQIIYLETINDITRLTTEEKKTAIYDQIRGYLYYIGRWK